MRDDKRRPPSGPRGDRAASGSRGERKSERPGDRPRGAWRPERTTTASKDEPRRAARPERGRGDAKFEHRSSETARPRRPEARPEPRSEPGHEPRSALRSEPRSEPRSDAAPEARPKFDPMTIAESRPKPKSAAAGGALPDFRKDRRNENRAKRWSDKALAEDGPVRIFGIHPVEAALLNPARQISRLLLTDNAVKRLEAALAKRDLPHESIHPRDLDRLLGDDTVHQGALLETEALPEPSLEDLADLAMKGGPLVVLDQVTDPHNVGAILRSAAAFGASGLVMTRRNSPPLTGVLAKSASGALEHVPVALVPNLAQALGKLGDLAILRIGLDGESEILIEDQDLKSGIALVLGAEGKGLRRLTQELCDRLCRITTAGALQSLNVSNAAAIALHAAAVQRRKI